MQNLATFKVSKSEECPENWFRFRNKCLKISENKTSDPDSEYCKRFNASLISIHSEDENMFISGIVSKDEKYYLGASSVQNTTQFHWIDGSELNYTKWRVGNPTLMLGDINIETEDGNHSEQSENISKDNYCELNWYRVAEKCVFRNDSSATKVENEINCQRLGATLVSVNSERENKLLSQLTNSVRIYWLGAERLEKGSNVYKWSDGSFVSQTFWKFSELTQTSSAKCVAFINGTWLESKCDTHNSQLCQKSVLPFIINDALPKQDKEMLLLNDKVNALESKVEIMSQSINEMQASLKVLAEENAKINEKLVNFTRLTVKSAKILEELSSKMDSLTQTPNKQTNETVA
ncbi:C-type mannose receptor 2-like protein [Leptotrombidium deliense]|uniref:C-type mannose receptor 2-like protein n=1 Tax=Leptotrombidium deliense TaxID=299467 RepID=A0A443S511_9ACAR|nr:C-type mannose receptor 2-like protein [Leptotrombidium deliense]